MQLSGLTRAITEHDAFVQSGTDFSSYPIALCETCYGFVIQIGFDQNSECELLLLPITPYGH